MESDSLVNRPVHPVEFVPASIVSSDGFIPIRRRAKRKRARIFESSDIGNVDNCLVNDNIGDTASIENGETVDIIIDDANSDSNNIVSTQASNSSVANYSNASMNDNSTNNNISCDIPILVMLIAVRMTIMLVVIVIVVMLLITVVIIVIVKLIVLQVAVVLIMILVVVILLVTVL